MSTAEERGPAIEDAESLYRCITCPEWWHDGRPSSAAFKSPKFSVNVASLTTLDATIALMHDVLECPNGGIVAFECGFARQLGYDPRLERDERHPENGAHAHVYFDGSPSQRMKSAKKLAMRCTTLTSPSFPAE